MVVDAGAAGEAVTGRVPGLAAGRSPATPHARSGVTRNRLCRPEPPSLRRSHRRSTTSLPDPDRDVIRSRRRLPHTADTGPDVSRTTRLPALAGAAADAGGDPRRPPDQVVLRPTAPLPCRRRSECPPTNGRCGTLRSARRVRRVFPPLPRGPPRNRPSENMCRIGPPAFDTAASISSPVATSRRGPEAARRPSSRSEPAVARAIGPTDSSSSTIRFY